VTSVKGSCHASLALRVPRLVAVRRLVPFIGRTGCSSGSTSVRAGFLHEEAPDGEYRGSDSIVPACG
jgi:hypothetical protein